MTTNELLEKLQIEIAELNAAHIAMQSSKNAWLDYRAELDAADMADDDKIESLTEKMGNAENEYNRVELSLRVKSEKLIGKGKELGSFWTTIDKMQESK